MTPNWAPRFVHALRSSEPPNFGIAGPLDLNNERLMTQSFVHCTHLHALGFYYAKIREFPCPQAPDWDRRTNGYDGTAGIRPCSVVGSREPVEEHRTSYLVDGEEVWPACSSTSTSPRSLSRSQFRRLHLLHRHMRTRRRCTRSA